MHRVSLQMPCFVARDLSSPVKSLEGTVLEFLEKTRSKIENKGRRCFRFPASLPRPRPFFLRGRSDSQIQDPSRPVPLETEREKKKKKQRRVPCPCPCPLGPCEDPLAGSSPQISQSSCNPYPRPIPISRGDNVSLRQPFPIAPEQTFRLEETACIPKKKKKSKSKTRDMPPLDDPICSKLLLLQILCFGPWLFPIPFVGPVSAVNASQMMVKR